MKYTYKLDSRFFLLLTVSSLILSSLWADDVNSVLEEYNQKNRLSQKTIDANKGHLVLFTREKLERMHAKTLKDVFKTTPVIFYDENRYALPDPLTVGGIEPYKSNFIRLYVDGVEITHGWAGSGLLLYGDLNIDFVDHIEFYYMTPSFETSVEPAFLTIFLYSKDPNRDSGGKLNLIGGSRGYNMETFSYGEQREDFSYMVNVSRTDARREKIDNGTPTPLSRDYERLQLFSYVKSENQVFHLQVMKKDMNSLAGASWDATPTVSNMVFTNLHLDYGINLGSYWKAQFAYDRLRIDINEADNMPLVWDYPSTNHLDVQIDNDTYTAELSYQRTIDSHRLHTGVKMRNKKLTNVEVDAKDIPLPDFSSEKVFSIFFQDQYSLTEQQMLSFGVSYDRIDREEDMVNDNLLQIRLGYIYTDETWSYKAYLYRTEVALQPLMRYFYPKMSDGLPAHATWGITQELSYSKSDDHRFRIMLHAMTDEEDAVQSDRVSAKMQFYSSIVNYDYKCDEENTLGIQLYYLHGEKILEFGHYDDIGGYFSMMNRYGDFDFYNGVVWHRNDIMKRHYFDWTSTITWNMSESFTVTLKGDNILDRANETHLYRWDVSSGMPTPIDPLSISPIDQRVTLELEYLF